MCEVCDTLGCRGTYHTRDATCILGPVPSPIKQPPIKQLVFIVEKLTPSSGWEIAHVEFPGRFFLTYGDALRAIKMSPHVPISLRWSNYRVSKYISEIV